MEELAKLLKKSFPTIDFDKEKHLTSDDLLDSISILTVIYILRTNYDLSISIDDLDSKNFESVETMWNLIEKLKKA